MPRKPSSRSEALEPADAAAAAAARIVTHMNADHRDSLVLYLQHLGRLWFVSARSPQMLAIDRAAMKIASTGPLGTESTRGLHTTVSFEPPLRADLTDARARLAAMDAEARKALGREPETVASYAGPRAAWEWGWWAFVLFAWAVLSRPANLADGSLIAQFAPAKVLALLRVWNPRFFRLMVGLHVLETAEMVTGKLRRYNVEFWSPIWWAWTLSCLFEGFTVWGRFDAMVSRVKAENEKKSHSKEE